MQPGSQMRPGARPAGAAAGQQQVRGGALNARPITGQQPNGTMAAAGARMAGVPGGAMPRAGAPSAAGMPGMVPAGGPAGAAGAQQRQASYKFTQNMRNPPAQQVPQAQNVQQVSAVDFLSVLISLLSKHLLLFRKKFYERLGFASIDFSII